MNNKTILVTTALVLALSAVSCGNDDVENSANITYQETTSTTTTEEKEEETTVENSASITYEETTDTTIVEEEKEEETTAEEISDVETVEMPDVTNMHSGLAKDQLAVLGLECEIRETENIEITPDYVISTEPEAGTEVQKGETVVLYVSTGIDAIGVDNDDISVDNYVGMIANDAVAFAEYAGLKPVIEFKESPEEKGNVIEQSIETGSTVDVGTEIIFYVSN